MKWWEKTVEYFFIRKYVPDEMILSPLDGKHELVGDTLLSSDENWVILEFKKNYDSLDSEKKKYKNYSSASKELSDQDCHHFLIYGHIQNGEFALGGTTYFSRKSVKSIKEIFASGIPKEEFINYLKKLIKHKTKGKDSSGGTVGSYSFVAGINKENQITSCMNLYEFGLDHGLHLEPTREFKKEFNRGYGGPSMSM